MTTTVVKSVGVLALNVTHTTGLLVNPIVITCDKLPVTVEPNQTVLVANVVGNTNANGVKTVLAVDYNQKKITVAGSGNAAYVSGGTVTREYATLQAGIAANGGNITAAGTDRIIWFETYRDGFLFGTLVSPIALSGATTDATHYRGIRPWTSGVASAFTHRYNPTTRVGVQIICDVDNTQRSGILLGEVGARLEGVRVYVQDQGATSGTVRGVNLGSDSLQIDAVTCESSEGDGALCAFECFGRSSGGGASGTRATLTNCVAVGSGVDGVGAVNGYHSTAGFDRFFNCDVWGVRGSSVARGFNANVSTQEVRNCVASGCRFADFGVSTSGTFDHCLSSDATAAGSLSYTGEAPDATFLYPTLQDFRLRSTSQAVNVGVDLSAFFTKDVVGATRTGQWEIGAFGGFASPPSGDPTFFMFTIGSDPSRYYATWDDFELATRVNLVALHQRLAGELYADSDFVVSGAGLSDVPKYARAVTDKDHYREIRVAPGHGYDPVTDTGVRILTSAALELAEPHARLVGPMLVKQTTAGTSDESCVHASADHVVVDGVFGLLDVGTGGTRAVFVGDGDLCDFRNSIAVGGTNTDGADIGFLVVGAASSVRNCDAARIRRGSTGTCFSDGGGGGVTFQNDIAGSSDVGFDVVDGWMDHCASTDATATGVGSRAGLSASDIWKDSAANDFRLIPTSVCVDGGANLSVDFTQDYLRAERVGAWEMGALTGYVAPPSRPPMRVGVTSRLVSCWTIEPLLARAFRFTSASCAIVHDGFVFPPGGSVRASARRAESGAKKGNMEVTGQVSDDFVSLEMLQADLVAGARVVEDLVDWMWPWLGAVKRTVYRARGSVRHDSETWTAQLEGLGERLDRNVGRLYTRADLDYRPGDIDFAADVQSSCVVDSVSIDRLEFSTATSGAGSIPGSYADGFFRHGRLTFKSGANVGRVMDVRAYTQSTRTVRLALRARLDIEVGDVFSIEPGFDLSFEQRRDKFDDGEGHRGFLFIPGGHRSLQAPGR